MFRFRQRQAALGIGKKPEGKGVFGHCTRIGFIIALRDRLGNIGECHYDPYDPTLVAGFELGVWHMSYCIAPLRLLYPNCANSLAEA